MVYVMCFDVKILVILYAFFVFIITLFPKYAKENLHHYFLGFLYRILVIIP